MSVASDKQTLTCDGDGCDAVTRFPVTQRSTVSPGANGKADRADGWLFVKHGKSWLHFCPRCMREYVKGL